MKRLFDIIFSFILGFLMIPLFILISFLILLLDGRPVLYWSNRVGISNSYYLMPKFRTMRLDTPVVATHLLDSPEKFLIPCGSLLRRYSLDELPQLWSILVGDMSFVGPRPALYSQFDLIELRTSRGIDAIKPGVTGLAQINGRDNLAIADKVALDYFYLQRATFVFDLKIIWLTLSKVLTQDGVSH